MDIFQAIAEPTRRSILELLAKRGQMSASQIANGFEMSAPAVSQHLQILKEAKLVFMEKKAQQRIYRINSKTVGEFEAWTKKLWNDRFDALEAVLESELKVNEYGKSK